MFENFKETYRFDSEEKELYFKIMMSLVFNIFSPFVVDKNIDFPNKDKLGGVVLRFIGGGSAYFKLQKEMPNEDEVKSVYDVCQFLKDSFGEYTVARIICQPDIEIRDIDVSLDDSIDVCYTSVRLNDGDAAIERLTEKLKNKDEYTFEDHIQRFILPFMARKDYDEFESKYSEFLTLFSESKKELPNMYKLTEKDFEYWKDKNQVMFNRIF